MIFPSWRAPATVSPVKSAVFPRTRVYLFATRSTFDPLKRDPYGTKKQRLASPYDLRDRIDCSRSDFPPRDAVSTFRGISHGIRQWKPRPCGDTTFLRLGEINWNPGGRLRTRNLRKKPPWKRRFNVIRARGVVPFVRNYEKSPRCLPLTIRLINYHASVFSSSIRVCNRVASAVHYDTPSEILRRNSVECHWSRYTSINDCWICAYSSADVWFKDTFFWKENTSPPLLNTYYSSYRFWCFSRIVNFKLRSVSII